MPNVYMIACGRIWESEIIIVTEDDAWRDTIEDAGLLLDLDAAASDLADDLEAEADDYADYLDDVEWRRFNC